MLRTDLQRLQPYPFERLRALLAAHTPPDELAPIRLSVGEPQLSPPPIVTQAFVEAKAGLATYPPTVGSDLLRGAIVQWLARRYDLGDLLDPERHVLPVNGTREALFAIAQATIDPGSGAMVLMPTPGYQIYEGAALLAGAEPYYLPCTEASGWKPDFSAVPDSVWARCRLVYVCSPGNPTGAVLSTRDYEQLLALADQHDFVIAADECYSEIYPLDATPAIGLLQVCRALGRDDFARCLVFHSLSKRSNLPGLRSGFVAGDADLIRGFLRYRTYHGCAMSQVVQDASVVAWQDEGHVVDNRAHYNQAFAAFLAALPNGLATRPEGSFYIWLRVPDGDDLAFTARLFAEQHVTVVPGTYLGRDLDGVNPGAGYVRISLVASIAMCREAAHRIAACLQDVGYNDRPESETEL